LILFAQLGGCSATTTLGGYTFHDGAVYLAVTSILDYAFAKIGLNRAELLPLRKITAKFSVALPDGTVVILGEGLNLSVTGRAVDTNRLHGELRQMMDKWRPVLRFVSEELALHPFSSWRMLQKGWRHLHKLSGTVASELNRLFSDHAVRSACQELFCTTACLHI
jgi:phytoene dehydrogenase-like protein